MHAANEQFQRSECRMPSTLLDSEMLTVFNTYDERYSQTFQDAANKRPVKKSSNNNNTTDM